MKRALIFATILPLSAMGEVTYGGFIDSYYAYDFNNPSTRDRQFTTQPSRHNEFNINLAYVEAVLKEDHRRGRLALQYGTSVDTNYAAEPSKNIQVIQEAYGGVKLNEKLWMEAGIFFSHIGIESYISKNNINYSRSMNADNVPYYASGIRFEYQIHSKEVIHVHLLNGWQNIQDNNSGKALGIKYQRILKSNSTFTYNNFLGDEKVTTASSRFRNYHNFIFEKNFTDVWKLQSSVDFGTQSQQENDGVNTWYGTSLILGQTLDQIQSMGYRVEYYLDPQQSNVATGTPHGFEVISASANYDRKLAKDTIWRSELRGFYSKDKIYPQGKGSKNRLDGFIATSLALSF